MNNEFGDDVMMVALHASGFVSNSKIQEFIDTTINDGTNYWFLRYGMNERIIPRERCRTEPLLTGNGVISAPFEKFIHTEINKMLGGKTTYPMTVIVDKDGKISLIKHGPLAEDVLKNEIIKLSTTTLPLFPEIVISSIFSSPL